MNIDRILESIMVLLNVICLIAIYFFGEYTLNKSINNFNDLIFFVAILIGYLRYLFT